MSTRLPIRHKKIDFARIFLGVSNDYKKLLHNHSLVFFCGRWKIRGLLESIFVLFKIA